MYFPECLFVPHSQRSKSMYFPECLFMPHRQCSKSVYFTGMAAEATAAALCRHGASDGKLYAILIYSLTRPCFWHVMPAPCIQR